ncbi:MAG TPA: methyltransferase [Candidatus Binatia bacterium]
MSEDLNPANILQIAGLFTASKTLLSAVELGVFTALASAPADRAALEKKLGLHSRSSADFLDGLVSLGLLARNGSLYSNTPETAAFLDRKSPSYIGGFLEMANARLYPFWSTLTDGLKTGQPQNEMLHGGPDLFTVLYSDSARLEQFARAMTGISMGAARAIAQKFPWDRYETFIDVGCAQGCVPVQVALAQPHIRGGGFDLPELAPIFDEYAAANGVGDRMKFYAGNFFEEPMPRADVLAMGRILHDWDLEQKKVLLKKALEALPDGGALIVYESLIDDDRRANIFGLMMSLNMLIETRGGFDFTGADCMKWMKEVGFRETWVTALSGPDSMAVGIK